MSSTGSRRSPASVAPRPARAPRYRRPRMHVRNRSTPKLRRATARDRSERAARSSSSPAIRSRASRTESASRSTTTASSGPRYLSYPGCQAMTTGSPFASASWTASGKPSASEGRTNASTQSSSSWSRPGSMNGRIVTPAPSLGGRSVTATSSNAGSAEPRKRSRPFFGTSRPTNSATKRSGSRPNERRRSYRLSDDTMLGTPTGRTRGSGIPQRSCTQSATMGLMVATTVASREQRPSVA